MPIIPTFWMRNCNKAIIPTYFEPIVETPHIEILGNQFQLLSYRRRGIPLGSHIAQSGLLGMLKCSFTLTTCSFCILTSGFEIMSFVNCNSDDIINNPIQWLILYVDLHVHRCMTSSPASPKGCVSPMVGTSNTTYNLGVRLVWECNCKLCTSSFKFHYINKETKVRRK